MKLAGNAWNSVVQQLISSSDDETKEALHSGYHVSTQIEAQ